MLSGRGLCDELITRPEESYRLCCVLVCDLETSRIGAPYIYIYIHIYIYTYIYDISSLRVNEHTKLTKTHDDLEKCNNTLASGLQLFKLLECKMKVLQLRISPAGYVHTCAAIRIINILKGNLLTAGNLYVQNLKTSKCE